MIHLFNTPWDQCSTVWLDTETTGTTPGKDAAVQVAIVRFEGGIPAGRHVSLVDPGMMIPEAATAIHGITNEMLRDAPTIQQVFARDEVRALLDGAQPGAFNATFDRAFVPLQTWGENWHWPWLDPLTFVRVIDRYERGKGRHRLENACERRGIIIEKAHDAGHDAEAAGRLFYRVAAECLKRKQSTETLGALLTMQRHHEAEEWERFNSWLASQPPVDTMPAFAREMRTDG